ncbi:hypothetical protein PFISCL1PPCAC_22913, partial [Pristionchus fissidentatus]
SLLRVANLVFASLRNRRVEVSQLQEQVVGKVRPEPEVDDVHFALHVRIVASRLDRDWSGFATLEEAVGRRDSEMVLLVDDEVGDRALRLIGQRHLNLEDPLVQDELVLLRHHGQEVVLSNNPSDLVPHNDSLSVVLTAICMAGSSFLLLFVCFVVQLDRVLLSLPASARCALAPRLVLLLLLGFLACLVV